MFDIVRTAELLPHEIDKILGVSRVTVSMWVNGHNKPHRLLENKVGTLLDVMHRAVEGGDLPLSPDVPREERHAKLLSIVAKHLKAMEAERKAAELETEEPARTDA